MLFLCSNRHRRIINISFYVSLSPSFCSMSSLPFPLGLNWRRCHRFQRSQRSQRMRWSVSLCLTSSNPFMTWMWSRERRLCSNVKWLVCHTPPSSGSTMAKGLRAPRTERWHSVSASEWINIQPMFRPISVLKPVQSNFTLGNLFQTPIV